MKIGLKEGEELVKLARESIKSSLEGKELAVDKALADKYQEKRGCFVTLNIDGELRGCIGYPEPVVSLYTAVVESASNAAFSDPRFPALGKDEFDKISVEVSVLGVPSELTGDPKEYVSQIKIGRDGLIIRGGSGSGLLLPQVFTEYDCDALKALKMTCQKAGLDEDEWMNADNKVYKFDAVIFKEEDGKVVEEKLS